MLDYFNPIKNYFKENSFIKIFFSLVALLAGGFIADVLPEIYQNWGQKQLYENPRLAYFIVSVFILAVIFTLLKLDIGFDKLNKNSTANHEKLQESSNTNYKNLETLSRVNYEGLKTITNELTEKVPVLFRYYPVDVQKPGSSHNDIPVSYNLKKLFEESIKIIREAKEEILAINAYAEEKPHPRELDNTYRISYFKELEKKINEGQIGYRRIIQTDLLNNEKLDDYFHETYLHHFKYIIQNKNTNSKNPKRQITLEIVPPIYPSTFLIVDNKFLIWQLNEVWKLEKAAEPISQSEIKIKGENKRDRLMMRGVIIVKDLGEEFIGEFKKTFNTAKAQDERKAVTKEYFKNWE